MTFVFGVIALLGSVMFGMLSIISHDGSDVAAAALFLIIGILALAVWLRPARIGSRFSPPRHQDTKGRKA